MRVRSGQLGLGRLDYLGGFSTQAIGAVATTWHTRAGAAIADKLEDALDDMIAVVADPGGNEPFHEAVDQARQTVAAMRHNGPTPTARDWHRLRAVSSGALPRPSRRAEAATRTRTRETQGSGTGRSNGRDGERHGAMQAAAERVSGFALTASRALTDTASL